MSGLWLVVRVALHARLYHGRPEWPPAPSRLFQALVAGNAHRLDDAALRGALEWLEACPAPEIAAPASRPGQAVTTFVPNNDLDSKQGDPGRLGELRVGKVVTARHLAHPELLYLWPVDDRAQAAVVVELAAALYQLGRGVDMAYATGEVVDDDALAAILAAWDGMVHRPSPGAPGRGLACPRPGSLASLERRHRDQRARFAVEGEGRRAAHLFTQAAKAVFRQVPYDARAQRTVFELRQLDDPGRFAPVLAVEAHACVVGWRNAAIQRLVTAGLDAAVVEGVLRGRRPGEPERVPRSLRARIIPLASIGHEHSDQAIRRLLVEVPAGGPLAFGDVRWAFSGLERERTVLAEDPASTMIERYEKASRRWASVIPVALPAARRRIDPANQAAEAKDASEREEEERGAVDAVRQALRHAGVRDRVREIEVQREPFLERGARAEGFAALPRFPKERLWHLRLTFAEPVERLPPLGDGRYVGLGLMRPAAETMPTAIALELLQAPELPVDVHALARHLRRAVLARCQALPTWARRALPECITGHLKDGAPAQGHLHLHYLVDLGRQRLVVWLPRPSEDQLRDQLLEKKSGEKKTLEKKTRAKKKSWERIHEELVQALVGLRELRAGEFGVLTLAATPLPSDDVLLDPATRWRSITPYQVERHRKAGSAVDAVVLDLHSACSGLPLAEVAVAEVQSGPDGLVAHGVELRFSRPVSGPLVLGRSRHLGGGLFEPAP